MQIHLVNPSNTTFGIAVMTPRWQFVLAGATPAFYGVPRLVDEMLEAFDPGLVQPGDVVGISIYTGSALRGYEVGRLARERGAFVVFGGIHASLFPEEARELGHAHAVVSGDGDLIWAQVLADCLAGQPKSRYDGGKVEPEAFVPARWALLPQGRYMWAIGPDSAWMSEALFVLLGLANGWAATPPAVLQTLSSKKLYSCDGLGFRFIALADDNFYPVTLNDLKMASRREDKRSSL